VPVPAGECRKRQAGPGERLPPAFVGAGRRVACSGL
jgi:hypothetical protein